MDIISAKDIGYDNNKDVMFKKIDGIYIEKFRSISKKNIILGDNITIISGKNGTMKSSLLGLIAHPFSPPNNSKDIFGDPLKTNLSNVFKLSKEKDITRYTYSIHATTSKNENISEFVKVYYLKNDDRHRIVVGKDHTTGSGNFSLNTSFINFKRLFPLIETNAVEVQIANIDENLDKFIDNGYRKIFQRDTFKNPISVSDKKNKSTFGPSKGSYYEYTSMSTGEDNLAVILGKMYSFIINKSSHNYLQGIFCIDELEAGFHPVAQVNLFNFIFEWSKKHNIQVVFTTHSLYLIQHALKIQSQSSNEDKIALNMISTAFVSNRNYNIIHNPSYSEAYKELTLKDADNASEIYELFVLCEDVMAEFIIKKIVARKNINKHISIMRGITGDEGNNGTSCHALKSLVKNGAKLLSNSIIIFDAEVQLEDLKKYTSVSYLKIPSIYNLPIEKEIAKYIYELDDSNDFFSSQSKEKIAFLNEFTDFNMVLDDTEVTKRNIREFKEWANSNLPSFKKYITLYLKANKEIFDEFLRLLYKEVNYKLEDKSIPILEIKM